MRKTAPRKAIAIALLPMAVVVGFSLSMTFYFGMDVEVASFMGLVLGMFAGHLSALIFMMLTD